MENRTFIFTSQNPKASRYLLICLLSFIMPFGVSFLNPILLMTVVVGALTLGFVLFSRHTKAPEKIKLYDSYLHSEIFGEIYYEDIVSAKPVVIDTGRGLRLKLNKGKKAWWLALKKEENPEYEAFVAALSEAVSHLTFSENTVLHQQKEVRSVQLDSDVTIEREKNKKAQPKTDRVQNSSPEIELELRNVQRKNKGSRKNTAIISGLTLLVLALLGLFKVYAPRWEQSRNEKERQMIGQGLALQQEKKANLMDSAQALIREYTDKNGPYFLYSNDSTATLRYLPVIQFNNPSSGGIKSLVLDDRPEKLKAFLANPDSASWAIALKTSDQAFYQTDAYTLGDRNLETKIYFTLTNKKVFVSAPVSYSGTGGEQVLDSIPLQLEFAVSLDTKGDLSKAIQEGLNVLKPYLRKHPESMNFFLAARQGEGRMDKDLFEKAERILKVQLAKMQVDTSGFKEKIF